jgi:hypothetical protein
MTTLDERRASISRSESRSALGRMVVEAGLNLRAIRELRASSADVLDSGLVLVLGVQVVRLFQVGSGRAGTGTFQLTHPRSGRATPCASAPVVGVVSVEC